jgi:hypothetical protein
VIIFTPSFPLVAHRRILDRKRTPEEGGALRSLYR